MITLIAHRSHLKGSNVNYVSLERNTVSTKALLNSIAARGTCPFSRALLATALELVCKEIVLVLSQGKAVDLGALGKLRPCITGKVGDTDTAIESAALRRTVRFTPAKALKASLANIAIGPIVREESNSTIESVTAVLSPIPVPKGKGEDILIVKKGLPRLLVVKGKRLKLTGPCNRPISPVGSAGSTMEEAGAYLVPVGGKEGECRVSYVFTNTPRELLFTIPREVKAGRDYRLKLCTGYSPSSKKHYIQSSYSKTLIRLEL